MFVQVIQGRTTDGAGLLAHGDRWATDVRPGAVGFVGSTVGVADDGTFVAVVRFEDEATARANSERPEQSEWWAGMEAFLDGEPTFRDSSDTSQLFGGPTSAAGFVQIMQGTAPDRAKAEAVETPELEAQLKAARPDLLGSLRVWFGGGDYLEAAYFTSEAAAREGEQAEGFEGPQEEFTALFGEPSYLDLRDPQHH